jgi:hypothetical protein
MAVFQALQTAIGAARRNPLLFVIVTALSLFQLPGLLAQSVHPLVGNVGSLGVSGLMIFVVQSFGHAVVIDDLEAVDSLKRSAWCVRHTLVAVFGYTVLAAVGGAVFGLFGGVFSLLTSGRSLARSSHRESSRCDIPLCGPEKALRDARSEHCVDGSLAFLEWFVTVHDSGDQQHDKTFGRRLSAPDRREGHLWVRSCESDEPHDAEPQE